MINKIINNLDRLEVKRQLWDSGFNVLDYDSLNQQVINCEFEAIDTSLRLRNKLRDKFKDKFKVTKSYSSDSVVERLRAGEKINLSY